MAGKTGRYILSKNIRLQQKYHYSLHRKPAIHVTCNLARLQLHPYVDIGLYIALTYLYKLLEKQ